MDVECSNIENPDSLRGVVKRLPFDLRKRLRSIAGKITEGENREIRFDDIIAFVEKEARTSSHPVFGDILRAKDQEKENKWARNTKFKNNNFATRVGDDNQAKGNGNSRSLTVRRTGAPSRRYHKAGGHCEMASSSRNLFSPSGRSSRLTNRQ